MSVFSEEWRACLREHYMYVIRQQDTRTERSLLTVMHETNFDDAELHELRVRATMHVDDMPADFVPDMTTLNSEAPPATVFAGVDIPVAELAEAPVAEIEAVPDVEILDEVLAASSDEVLTEAEALAEVLDDIEGITADDEVEDAIDSVEDDSSEDIEEVIDDEDDEDDPQQLSMF